MTTCSCDSHLRSKTPLLMRQSFRDASLQPGVRMISRVSSSARQCLRIRACGLMMVLLIVIL